MLSLLEYPPLVTWLQIVTIQHIYLCVPEVSGCLLTSAWPSSVPPTCSGGILIPDLTTLFDYCICNEPHYIANIWPFLSYRNSNFVWSNLMYLSSGSWAFWAQGLCFLYLYVLQGWALNGYLINVEEMNVIGDTSSVPDGLSILFT